MLIHNEIRKEVITLLRDNFPDIPYFYNGRANFINVEDSLPAVSVALDNAECQCVALGGIMEWEADLIISFFIPLKEKEEKLDTLSENITKLIFKNSYRNIGRVKPEFQYQYDYDEQQFIWTAATLTFHIEYARENYFDDHYKNGD